MSKIDSFQCVDTLKVGGRSYQYVNFKKAAQNGLDVSKLPTTLKILVENLLRNEDGKTVTKEDILAFKRWLDAKGKVNHEIAYRPARVLMQDFTGVPAVVDLAAMRDAVKRLGGDPESINPLSPVDLVIDHSVSVDHFGNKAAFEKNVAREFQRNNERYEFLRWAQKAFDNFRVVPPGAGICHQVNLEYLAKVVFNRDINGSEWAYPDTLVGTDSHTTMINGLSVLGWGVGGIEAEAAMLAQPISMLIPEVVGFKLEGVLSEGLTATDLVLTVVEKLRAKGVVGKFVEFYGSGVSQLTLADRATLANMAPEYGATCGFFGVDDETLNYLKFSGRETERVELVEAYNKAQGMWFDPNEELQYTDTLSLDLAGVKPSIAGPKRPQDRIELVNADTAFHSSLKGEFKHATPKGDVSVKGKDFQLHDGSVVIAAITSCTNTSNPSVMIAAGLVAKKARALGMQVKPWVKTSLAPGSQVVSDYLEAAGLQSELDGLGFNLVGYGCTTCIGNSGPLATEISEAIHGNDLVATSVLSGNRNFEGRVSPDVKANYLASPPLVVAYALAGSMTINITKDPIGQDKNGKDVFLKDVWPSHQEIKETVGSALTAEMFKKRYSDVFAGSSEWQSIAASDDKLYQWNSKSTYVQHPPFFSSMTKDTDPLKNVKQAKILALLGNSVTTDHISPAGAIKSDGPAGDYLKDKGVERIDFNSFGSRRGNHEIMMRGTFANIRIKNQMAEGKEGGYTKNAQGKVTDIYSAAMDHVNSETPLVVFAGKEYGTGSSRDWAAKGTLLLGVKAVVAESFERIHRSNLIGMGVLPLEFEGGADLASLGLNGTETIDIEGVDTLKPQGSLSLKVGGKSISVKCRIDTDNELDYYKHGGILNYVIRQLV